MIEFQSFDIEDNARYLEHLRLCIQIPSNLSPLFLLGRRKGLKLRRGYADKLCWHTFSANGEDFLTPPAGDWDEIDWQKVFAAHVPAGTKFRDVPEYLVKLWQRDLGDSIDVTDDRDL